MSEPQQTEEFTIIGIQSEYAARGHIKYEDLRSLVADNLQMQPVFDLIIQILVENHNVQIVEKIKLDIQTIYSCFNHLTFLKEVPKFLNGRLTVQNVQIVKAAIHLFHDELLTVKDIKDACLIFHLREQELLSEGIPIGQINNLLWPINKAISTRVLEEWIRRCSDFLQVRGYIQAFEFLFLMANTVDRWAYFNKYPKSHLDLTRDPKYNLYNVDSTGFRTVKNPDAKIQHYMNYQYNLDKATFKGRSLKDRDEHYQQKRNLKFQQFIKKKETTIGEFKKILRDPELYVEIRQRLKNAQQIINHSKLNGKMLRVQLLEEFSSNPIQQIKENHNFLKITQRPESSQISQIKSEVEQHKTMMQDTGFVTEFMQRTVSAGSMGTTKCSFRKPQLKSTTRPQTGNNTHHQQSQLCTIRPLTANTNNNNNNINNILDQEISIYEAKQEETQSTSKIVFYGSANSIKRSHNINTPWQSKQLTLF